MRARPLPFSGDLLSSTKNTDTYSGASEQMSLSDMLDNIPVSDLDPQGANGMKRDASGVDRLKQQDAANDVRAYAKYEATLAKEAAMQGAME